MLILPVEPLGGSRPHGFGVDHIVVGGIRAIGTPVLAEPVECHSAFETSRNSPLHKAAHWRQKQYDPRHVGQNAGRNQKNSSNHD